MHEAVRERLVAVLEDHEERDRNGTHTAHDELEVVGDDQTSSSDRFSAAAGNASGTS